MFGGDGGMNGFLLGSGWVGLLGCLVLGGVGSQVLGLAGRRRAQGRPWTVSSTAGGLLVAIAVASALSSFGTFFGFMGVAFAVVTVVGAVSSFGAARRQQERLREQELHAERLGAAYARGAGSAPTPPGPESSQDRPSWYGAADGGGDQPGRR